MRINQESDAEAAEQASRLPEALRALRHRNFQLFFAGQLVSLTGTWMQSVAQSWLVYRLTGSAVLLGSVGFANQIPVFLLAALGGTIADRYRKQRILIATQALAMLLATTLAALTLSGRIQVWHVFVIAASLGIVNAFDIPARQSFVVEMVGKRDLINAIALNSSMFNAARIVGPAVAGIMIASIGEGWCFAANAASYIGVIAGLLLMRVAPRVNQFAKASALASIREGFRFVARTTPVRALLMLLGLVSLMGMPYAVLMPIFAREILGGGASGLGMLMGASGLGALIGAITLAMRGSERGVRGLGRWVGSASAGFGASIILFAMSRSFWLSALLLVPAGFCMMVQMASSNTLVQAMVPDELRGRVMAVYSMMFMGMAPFGALLAGTLATHLGAPTTVIIGGAACIIGATVFRLRLPVLRVEARKILVALEMASGHPAEAVTGEGNIVSPQQK
ncbi:MAG: MFS transporter [Pyrinomonadaceae bacterium]